MQVVHSTKKEGNIAPYMDIEEIAINGRNNIILMDNNILASDYGIHQIEKIVKLGLKIDFNQGLDARLVTDDVAKLLAEVKWIKRIRFGCDTPKQIEDCERAMRLIDSHGFKGEYFLYCILLEFEESYQRINYWRGKWNWRVLPYAQPFRHLDNKYHIIPEWQKDLARWVDRKELYKTCEFKDYEPRKGFKCINYF